LDVPLDAAPQVCAQRGIDGVRMREAAGHARVNAAFLHYHFLSKADVARDDIENFLLF